jgi:hypothetical protein
LGLFFLVKNFEQREGEIGAEQREKNTMVVLHFHMIQWMMS